MIYYYHFQHVSKIMSVGSDHQWLPKQLGWNADGKLCDRCIRGTDVLASQKKKSTDTLCVMIWCDRRYTTSLLGFFFSKVKSEQAFNLFSGNLRDRMSYN